MDKLESLIRRVFFYGAFVLLVVAAVEKMLNFFGTSFLKPAWWQAHDVLEFAAIALIFAIAMQLHQIRLLLSKSNQPK